MPRPKKCRKVCRLPLIAEFYPSCESKDFIVLTVDEYETIRLIDKEAFSQEEVAQVMQVSRPTIQQNYNAARYKLADAIVNAKAIRIEGGCYKLCKNNEKPHGCEGCLVSYHQQLNLEKENSNMKVAVTYENGQVFQHFGHTQQFKVFNIKDNEIVSSEILDANGSGHGALATLLASSHVDVLLCGGIGMGAQNALSQAGIQLYGGINGDADEAVHHFLAGTLSYDPDVACDHHGHHDGEHTCGEHTCGEHHCHE